MLSQLLKEEIKEEIKVLAWLLKSLLNCFIPLPWQTHPALHQISLRADLVTPGWFGPLTQSWALWLWVCLALGCLFQQTHQQDWFSLIIRDQFSVYFHTLKTYTLKYIQKEERLT